MAALAYLITFTCYGTHLPGSEKGSVDRRQNRACSPSLEPNKARERYKASLLKERPLELEECHRQTVLRTIQDVCDFRGWTLLAAHIRSTHVHAVVNADARPEKVMLDMKAYATRALRQQVPCRERFWTQHGSTRYLYNEKSLAAAIEYVVNEQGPPMESIFLKEPEA